MNDYGKSSAVRQIREEAEKERREERAAILEFEAGYTRAEAERLAGVKEKPPGQPLRAIQGADSQAMVGG